MIGEEDVVVLPGVEGRIEIDEVDGLGGDVLAEDLEVVAVVELVLLVRHWVEMRLALGGDGLRGNPCPKGGTWGTRLAFRREPLRFEQDADSLRE